MMTHPRHRARGDLSDLYIPVPHVTQIFHRLEERIGVDRRGLIGALVLMFLAAWAFVELADDAPEGDYLAWEISVMRSIRGGADEPGGPAWLPAVAKFVTHLGGSAFLVPVTLGAMAWLRRKGRTRAAIFLAATVAVGHLLNFTFKQSFARERPDAVIHLVETNSPSFPSGHSMAATISYLAIAVLLAQNVKHRRHQAAVLVFAFAIIFLVGLSRVYLGVHYPTDVAAGWAAGTAWAVAAGLLAAYISRRPHARR